MGRADFLSHGYTDTLSLALDANTDLETGSDLIAAARKFSETYCKECNDGMPFSEEDINFFMVDIIAYFNDVGLDIDIRRLTKLFVLDKKLYEFTNSMGAGKGDYSYIWKELTAEKKDDVSAALKVARAYWSDAIDH